MAKISNKMKAALLKGYILFCFLYLLLFLYVIALIDTKHPELEPLGFAMVLLDIVLVSLMVFLMGKVDISPEQVIPNKKVLTIKDYGYFCEALFKQASEFGFGEYYSMPVDERTETSLAFKDVKGATYILQTIWMQEMDMDILDKATEVFWQETEMRVGVDKIQYQAVGLMQCICVQRMNTAFRKFVSQNVPQKYKRYQILTAISFGGKTAYICQTKGGFYRSYVRFLQDMFERLTEEILSPTEK